MGSFLTESVPVSLSGALGNAGNYRLYACDQPNVVLYVARQPRLMLDEQGKPGVAVTAYTTQAADGSYKITSGAATIAVNTAPDMDASSIEQAKALVAQSGVADPNQLKLLPLTTQKGIARLSLPIAAGAPDEMHNKRDVGTPGGSLSFLANLTEQGAMEWSQAIKNQTRVNGDITIQYDYLRRVPDVGAEVKVHGSRVFEHLSAALDVSYNGFWYGGSAKLEAAWNDLTRNGGVEVVFLGQGLPPELETYRQEMVTTFTKQAMQILFDQIFAPMPQVAPAQAEDSSGVFGGANFAMKWQKSSDSIDMTQQIQFRGTTWLTETMDISLAALFAGLDPACLTEVPVQQAFETGVTIDGDPQLASTSVSLNWSEGRAPAAPIFGSEGGLKNYTVVSTNPSDVVVDTVTKINYEPPNWPIVTTTQSATVRDGGGNVIVKPSAWIGRTWVYMFVEENGKIVVNPTSAAEDYLVLNVSYEGPHLANPVRASQRIDANTPIEFAYPLDPQGRPGVAKFSAFGVIGGQMKRANEQVIPVLDTAVQILATRGGDIRLLTSDSPVPEDDELAADLVRGKGRPIVVDLTGTGGTVVESDRPQRPDRPAMDGDRSYGEPGAVLVGRTVGVEYGVRGTALWMRLADGTSRRVRLHADEDWSPFEKQSRDVEVHLDGTGEYADYIRAGLTA